jgi:hypothetical protein
MMYVADLSLEEGSKCYMVLYGCVRHADTDWIKYNFYSVVHRLL